MPIPHHSAETLDTLRQYDTPTVSNVIELFEIRPRSAGYMDGRIRACFPEMPAIVGYASTVTMRCAVPRASGPVYNSLDDQINAFAELPGPPIVVFQDLDDPPVAATFGEIMCTTYQSFGAQGLITSGAARDLDQVRRIGFPCFSNGVICSHGFSHILDVHVPVRVGGLTVQPGDLIHADCNGVVQIPHEIASEVAGACADFAACEAVILDYLKTGERDPRHFSDARKETMRRISELSRQVRAKRQVG
jgi:regulator of RNase E activity RraA